jgi:hypothetical protein
MVVLMVIMVINITMVMVIMLTFFRLFIWLKQASTNNRHCLCNPADCDCTVGRNIPPVSQTSTML